MVVNALWDVLFAGVFGLLVGSFLNVVIHRLPLMMERQWMQECAEHARTQGCQCTSNSPLSSAPLTLSTPRSRCPHCNHAIRWFENIPVLSYLALRGRCAHCHAAISLRYPLVEVATAALFGICIAHWDISPAGIAWCGFGAALLCLAFIDWDTTLLPDSITLPLLWAGLVCSALRWIDVSLIDALWGAVAGYLSLWSVFWGFKLLTGKEGMGYGDFKLFAALGAWFGWQGLLPIILMASVVGAVIGIVMKLAHRLREGGYIPFGPFLAGGGFVSMFLGPETVLRQLYAAMGM